MSERQAKRIFLTGATGFLGSHLCDALLKDGHHVTTLARASKTEAARDRVTATLRRVTQDEEGLEGRLDCLESRRRRHLSFRSRPRPGGPRTPDCHDRRSLA